MEDGIKRKISIKTVIFIVIFLLAGLTLVSMAQAPNPPVTGTAPKFSYDDYATVLSTFVNDKGFVFYQGLQANRTALDQFLVSVAELNPNEYVAWTDKDKIAFWINVFNAQMMQVVIDNYDSGARMAIGSRPYDINYIRRIPNVWRAPHMVMGKPVTLDEIQHKILRGNFHEPRIGMALVSAAKGSPPLRNEPYLGTTLDAQLEDQTSRFLADPADFRIDRWANIVYLPLVFGWYGSDFNADYGTREFNQEPAALRPMLNFVAMHVNPRDQSFLKSQHYSVSFLNFDWSLNEQ